MTVTQGNKKRGEAVRTDYSDLSPRHQGYTPARSLFWLRRLPIPCHLQTQRDWDKVGSIGRCQIPANQMGEGEALKSEWLKRVQNTPPFWGALGESVWLGQTWGRDPLLQPFQESFPRPGASNDLQLFLLVGSATQRENQRHGPNFGILGHPRGELGAYQKKWIGGGKVGKGCSERMVLLESCILACLIPD